MAPLAEKTKVFGEEFEQLRSYLILRNPKLLAEKKFFPVDIWWKKCSRRRWHHRTAFGEKISRRRWHPSPQFCGILISRLSRKNDQDFFFILRVEKEWSHRINCGANRECVNVRATHQSTRPQLSNLDSFFLPIVFQIVRTLRDRWRNFKWPLISLFKLSFSIKLGRF